MASQTVTSQFIQAFRPGNEAHVKWLGRMFDMAESMADPSTPVNIVKEINKNPMGVKLGQNDALDWAHIHFVLSAKYAQAVWKGQAWIPPKN